MVILGIDPGFVSLGWALLDFSGARPRCLGAGVIRTKANPKARKCDDNKARIAKLARELRAIEQAHEPVIIAAEAQSWTRFQKADRALAMAWGCIATLGELHAIPVLQFTPQEIKRSVAGGGSASKEAVQQALETHIDGAAEHLAAIAKTQQNHAADALGAAYKALEHDVTKTVSNVYDWSRGRRLDKGAP